MDELGIKVGLGLGTAVFPAIVFLVCAVLVNAGRSLLGQTSIIHPQEAASFVFLVFFFIGFSGILLDNDLNMILGRILVISFLLSLGYYILCHIRKAVKKKSVS